MKEVKIKKNNLKDVYVLLCTVNSTPWNFHREAMDMYFSGIPNFLKKSIYEP